MFGLYRDNNAKCIHKKITFGFGINEADQKRKTKKLPTAHSTNNSKTTACCKMKG